MHSIHFFIAFIRRMVWQELYTGVKDPTDVIEKYAGAAALSASILRTQSCSLLNPVTRTDDEPRTFVRGLRCLIRRIGYAVNAHEISKLNLMLDLAAMWSYQPLFEGRRSR